MKSSEREVASSPMPTSFRDLLTGPFLGPDAEEPVHPLPIDEETKWLRDPRDLLILVEQSQSVTSCVQNLMLAFVVALVRMLAFREPGARMQLVGYGYSAGTRGSLIPVAEGSEVERLLAIPTCDGPVYLPTALALASSLADTLLSPYHVVLLANQVGTHPRRALNAAAQLKHHAVVDCLGIGIEEVADPKGVLRNAASTNTDGSKRVHWVTTHHGMTTLAESLACPIDLRSRAQRILQSYARKGRL